MRRPGPRRAHLEIDAPARPYPPALEGPRFGRSSRTSAPATAKSKPKPRPRPCSLRVASNPSGASIFLNGHNEGVTPFSRVLPCGKHSVRLAYRAMKTFSRGVDLRPGKPVRVAAKLEPTTPAVAKPAKQPAASGLKKPAAPAVKKPAAPAVKKPVAPAVKKPAAPAVNFILRMG